MPVILTVIVLFIICIIEVIDPSVNAEKLMLFAVLYTCFDTNWRAFKEEKRWKK